MDSPIECATYAAPYRMTSLRHIAIPTLLALTLTAHAAKWDEMDYGRFLTASYCNAESKTTLDGKGCVANKGIAIKARQQRGRAAFRYGSLPLRRRLDRRLREDERRGLRRRARPDSRTGGPGEHLLSSESRSRLERGRRFRRSASAAQRPAQERGETGRARSSPTCPSVHCPHDWAKYRGLYLHGDDVVVNYARSAPPNVLEMPGLEKSGEVTLLTRTFNVESAGAGASVALADGTDG